MGPFVAALLLLLPPPGAQAPVAPRPPSEPAQAPGMISVRVVPGDPLVEHDLREAREQIERRRDNGELTRREARRLRREARLIATLSQRYASDGLSDAERRELQMRTSELKARSQVSR